MHVRRDKQDCLLDLIAQVYDAALDDGLWPGMAAHIAKAFHSTSTVLFIPEIRHQKAEMLSVTDNLDRSSLSSFESYYAARDVWAQRAAKSGLSKAVIGEELIRDDEFIRTEFYNDWARFVGLRHVVGALFPTGGEWICAVAIHRPPEGIRYEEGDKTRLTQLLPHLKRALQLRRGLADPAIERHAALDMMERSGTGVLVVTRDGKMLYTNRQAESVLSQGDAIRMLGGRLTTGDPIMNERLRACIRDAVDTAAGRGMSSGGVLAIERPDRLPLSLLVAPFRPAREGIGAPIPAAILFVRDPEGPSSEAIALQGLFGLTPAEAAVSALLADGKSLEDAASTLRVSVYTVRAHLRAIFAKTGTNRQGQLVSLILRSVAALAGR